jgi:uncharacterized protein
MMSLTLSELFIYPVKSAAGIAVTQAHLTPWGLAHDRRYMVVDAQGKFMSQRRFPQMALIRVALAEQMSLTAPGMPALALPLKIAEGLAETAAQEIAAKEVDVWGDRTQALSAGTQAQAWISQFLGTDCELVYMPESSRRPVDHGRLGADELVSFADAYPYLLLSTASLAGLNQKLTEPVPMNRFRPNLVISGCETPHAEDQWQRIRIGEAVFSVAKACSRCSVPNVDQQTGDRNLEPSKTLATYRAWDKNIWFGQNLVQETSAAQVPTYLKVGDPVEVLA